MHTSRAGRLQARGLVALILSFALALALAAAVLPDASWMGGFFDAGDEESLLALFWDPGPSATTATMSGSPLECVRAGLDAEARATHSPAAFSLVSRAPPAA